MSAPILVTKLFIPPAGSRTVARPRLIERLNAGVHGALTLVSAPAGFGKTTLVSRWATECGRPVAWLSLDEGDSDPVRFFTYLVATLQTVMPGLREESALGSAQSPPSGALLTALLNEIATVPESIVLVLDDYHLVDSPPVDDALAFLLDHLPPQLHLVITTREDPRLPLARLRARGRMTEMRAADLRFTADETAAFLNETMGLELTARDVEALETRTEGWIVGLQLAALSMRGRDDISAFIQDFAGDNRYVVDYLVEEVLRRQPEDVRDFLLQTSILDRLCGPLCDAVTGQGHGAARLEALERGNVFVVPLDGRRRWYRYHHLFADVLRAYLLDEQPDLPPELHRRASAWHEQHGDRAEAVRHALAAEEHAVAADLIELAMPDMRRTRREATLHDWLDALPGDVVRRRPRLSVDYAGVLLSMGETEKVESLLRGAELQLELAPSETAETSENLSTLPGWIAIYRAGLAQARGDSDETIRHASQALDLLPEDDHLGHGAAAGLLGLAHWARGDLEAGHRMYAECMNRLRQAGFIADTFGCALALADIRIAQGRLNEAMSTYERTLQFATEHDGTTLRGTADMHVGIAGILRERGDLEGAIQHLMRSRELGEHMGLPQNPYRWCVTMAQVRESQGDLDAAMDLLDEAERRYVGDLFPNVRPIAAMKARITIRQGRLGEAFDWAHEHGLTTDDDVSYLAEFGHITLARALIAQFRRNGEDRSIRDTEDILDRLLTSAEDGGRTGSVIEILMLQALALEAQDKLDSAIGPLQRALSLAEPEGYLRMFVDEGAPMERLLSEAGKHGVMPDYAATFLAAFDTEHVANEHAATPTNASGESLTERELEVLRLVAEGHSNREIADRLFLALDTVKGHNRRIFAKLDVQRRTEAIARARELELL